MHGLLLLAAASLGAAGCAQASSRSCDLQKLVDGDVLGHGAVVHCESFLENTDGGAANAMLLAQECVLSALGKGLTFTLLYDDPIAGDHLSAAISGYRGANDRSLVRYYAASVNSAGQPQISVKTCNAASPSVQPLDKSPGCTPAAGRPCLTCNSPGSGLLLCGGQ